MSKSVKSFPEVVPAIGPYSHVCEAGGFVYLSGQIAIDTEGNLISESLEEQTKYVFKNIGTILDKLGLRFQDIVKITVYMTDLSKFGRVNEIYARYFDKDYPVRTTIGVRELPKNAQIELDVICIKN